jgi:K319-like protein
VTVVGQKTPVVNAGAPQLVNSAALVTLAGSAVDPNGNAGSPLKFQWTQTAGPTVALTGAGTAAASFTAPTMAVGQPTVTLSFKLTVTDSRGLSGSATTSVTVQPIPDKVTIINAVYRISGSRLQVEAGSSVTNGLPVLTLHVPGHPDVVMTFDPTLRVYNVIGDVVNPMPTTVTVTSSYGGSASSPITRVK